MAKRLKGRLFELNNLSLCGQERSDYLAKNLRDKSNLLVANAARIIAKEALEDLETELIANFERLLKSPLKSDPGCAGKTAILETLISLDCSEHKIYLKAIKYLQLEPVFGGKEDTAVKLRVLAAQGLLNSNYYGVVNELAGLLADNEIQARAGAISALANCNSLAAVPILRYKALIGDKSIRVLSACFDSLLALEPHESRDFVASFLEDKSALVAETAALCLGEARIEGSLEILAKSLEKAVDNELQKTIITAISLLRSESAIDYLFELIKKQEINSSDAIAALKLFADQNILDRLEQISLAFSRDACTISGAQI